jgi:hypothetical protein
VRGLWRGAAAAAVLAAAITACQERLTSPAECPALCPGGSATVFDTVVVAEQSRDSSYAGYVGRGSGTALLLSSDGFAPSNDRAIYKFAARGDSLSVRDTLRSYTVDSVTLGMSLVARDTLVTGLKIYLYRLPSSVDSTATFAEIDAQLNGATLIDSIAVPDSVHTGAVTAVLRSGTAGFAQVALPPGGDSVLAIGLKVAAAAPTGIRLGTLTSSNAALFTTYVTADVPDTGTARHPTLSRGTVFNTFVTQNPLIPADSLLTVGGEPASRALVRFGLSSGFLDSATIIRATLELTPVRPIIGLSSDPSIFQALAVLADIGAKSPLTQDLTQVRQDTLPTVQSDTLQVEITNIVQLWQSSRARPQSLFLRLAPEAATFARSQFFSTRSHAGDTLVAPRLRITYQRAFSFETP